MTSVLTKIDSYGRVLSSKTAQDITCSSLVCENGSALIYSVLCCVVVYSTHTKDCHGRESKKDTSVPGTGVSYESVTVLIKKLATRSAIILYCARLREDVTASTW